MELVGDICQLSLSDIIEFAVAYIEYIDIGYGFMPEEGIIEDYFSGKSVGWRVLEIIKMQRSEIMAYMPERIVEMQYLRTVGNGVFIYARTTEPGDVG